MTLDSKFTKVVFSLVSANSQNNKHGPCEFTNDLEHLTYE